MCKYNKVGKRNLKVKFGTLLRSPAELTMPLQKEFLKIMLTSETTSQLYVLETPRPNGF